MRSVEEIDSDIAKVKAAIAKRDKANAYVDEARNTPEYRMGLARYILHGDMSGVNSALQRAQSDYQQEQNRLSTEKLTKIHSDIADEDGRFQWQRDYARAKSTKREVDANKASTEKDKRDAAIDVRFYEDVGYKKGYLKPTSNADVVKDEEAEADARKKQSQRESTKRKLEYFLGKDNVSDEDLEGFETANKTFFDTEADAPLAGYESTYWDNQSKIDALRKANRTARGKKYIADMMAKLEDKSLDTEGKIIDLMNTYAPAEDYSDVEGWDKFQTSVENMKKGKRDAAAEARNRKAAANNVSAEQVRSTSDKTVTSKAGNKSYVFDVVPDDAKGVYYLKIGNTVYRTINY